MKILLIGNRKRFEKYMPDTEFVRGAEKVCLPLDAPEEEIIRKGKGAEGLAVDAIGRVSGNVIRSLPDLKIIHSEGVGFNGIDTEAARECGVDVCNNRGINARAVAEQTVLLILGLLRTVIPGHQAVLKGQQIRMKEKRMIEGIAEVGDCRIGLIGFGAIARETAKLLRPFGAEVVYFARHRADAVTEEECHASYLERGELLRTSDIVSLHVPVTPETEKMADAAFFRVMKPTAYLINTARGEIVDNEALVRALEDGEIAGAGLDTIAPEPVEADHPLLHLSREASRKVIYSPHLGGITTSTFVRAHSNIWTAMEAVSRGEKPANIVN